ncbi:MAG TPA: histidine phosphatase family protein [Oculatellaceae cyanobacterium]
MNPVKVISPEPGRGRVKVRAVSTLFFSACLSFGISFFSQSPAMSQDDAQMIFAVDVIRHGDRAPIDDFKNAPFNWPRGLGQLTAEGMDQEFQLGKQFRARYIDKYHLLPEHYDFRTMYVRASDVDRTLMSAECTLMGLYPLGTGPVGDDGAESAPSRYQPIPIHTRPREADDVLVPDASKGVRDVYKKFVYDSDEWKQRTAKESPNFDHWSKVTGITITDLKQMSGIGDTVHIRQIHHVPMPEGMTKDDAESMMSAGEWVFAHTFKPAEVGEATGGKLLALIARYLDSATTCDGKLKYVLFSAHDSTICSLMSAMRSPIEVRPPYSSDLSISLWKRGDSFVVRAALNGVNVNFPGAKDGEAPLEAFKKLVTVQAEAPKELPNIR